MGLYQQGSAEHRGDKESVVVLYNTEQPGVAEALHATRASFQDRSDLEALDEHHMILVIRPGVPEAAT